MPIFESMPPTRLFHVGPMLLEPGAVILPGNWGRVLNHPRRRRDDSYWREVALEDARSRRFARKPSRFNSVFALPSFAAVRAYRCVDTKILSPVYEIEPVDTTAPIHIGCWQLGSLDEGRHDLADAYWRGLRVDTLDPTSGMPNGVAVGLDDACAEVLIGGKARIVRRLEESELA